MSVLTSIWRHVKEHPWRGSFGIALDCSASRM